MNIAQYYKIIGNGTAVTPDMQPAMFVFGNDNVSILGFIYKVTEYTVDIVMFDPTATSESNKVLIIAEKLEFGDVMNKLREALLSNPRMIPIWEKSFGVDFTQD